MALKEGVLGFVSQVAGLANSYRISGFSFKSYRFSGFEMCHGLLVLPFFELGFWVFSSKIPIFPGFKVIQGVSKGLFDV